MNFVGCNIKYLRKKNQLSQCELAERIGLRRGNIASYEKSIAEPKIDNLVKLAEFFRIKVTDLVTKDLQQVETTGSIAPAPIEIKKEKLETIIRQSQDFGNILKGMRCYHSFRMNQIAEKSEEVKMLNTEIQRLLEVSDSIIKAHEELIELIAKNQDCFCDEE